MRLLFVLISSTALLSGCAARPNQPIVDLQGVNMAQYTIDLQECQAYADQVEAGREVVQGAIGGAVVGGAVGAAVGDSDTAKRAAGVGAIGGAARGAVSASREREQIIRNCLRGRGYRVLN
ncbi:MAG: hypothetical protein RLZZ385_988 [Pseudomonadota bacterium]|jgi:outer membrane lipoprotein SlyB